MMSRSLGLFAAFSLVVFAACLSMRVVADERSTETQSEFSIPSNESESDGEAESYTPKSETELRRSLTRIQFDVTQNEATEPAFRNKYWNNKDKGIYECIVCGLDLFKSDTKFKSGTGWPSFYAPLNEKSVGYKTDNFLFYKRTEVHCARCGAHLGHVFDDGPKPTGKRYCMNSSSMNFVETKASTSDKASVEVK
ncbi:Peptide methionine sulfoxide reductase MsrB [Rubripirellula tenax]|uniref:peptide-methionine (R)-S-oxide reductase n=1 Tax=Rubripirellula tenax TaxID=2528015 RepID=A0A5C6EY94_9BACT|nr:peptide-methionine (R)-S-oxide reductase MsrB [Rubripirellula tenax]TWU54603.1 Peptide methionine sulfoxide reductase MsrB [Rubripirellula tenax]